MNEYSSLFEIIMYLQAVLCSSFFLMGLIVNFTPQLRERMGRCLLEHQDTWKKFFNIILVFGYGMAVFNLPREISTEKNVDMTTVMLLMTLSHAVILLILYLIFRQSRHVSNQITNLSKKEIAITHFVLVALLLFLPIVGMLQTVFRI